MISPNSFCKFLFQLLIVNTIFIQSLLSLLLFLPSVRLYQDQLIEKSNCRIFAAENNQTCLRCSFGYILSTNGLECIPNDSLLNCVQIGIFGECIVCACGFSVMSTFGECVATPSELNGCQIFDGEYCIRPKVDFTIIISPADPASETKMNTSLPLIIRSKSIEYSHGLNCEVKQENYCIRCHHGYKLTSSQSCVRFPLEILNSFYSYFDGDTLMSRDIHLFGIGNGIYKRIENCNQHSLLRYIKELPNNNEAKGNRLRCKKCELGRSTNESQTNCYRNPIDHCDTVSDTNPLLCISCNHNYFLISLPADTKSQHPNVCVPRTRRIYEDGCLEYMRNSDGCLTCRPPFERNVSTNKCVIPSSDQLLETTHEEVGEEEKRKNEQRESTKVVQNCLVYNSNKECIECQKGFMITTKKSCSLQSSPTCDLANESGMCLHCKRGFSIWDNSSNCLKERQEQLCKEYDNNTSRCVACASGYYLSNQNNNIEAKFPERNNSYSNFHASQCSRISNCRLSNGISQICEICDNLYFPNFNGSVWECLLISENLGCHLSDGISNRCQTCKAYFVKSAGSTHCVPRVTHHDGVCHVYGFYIPKDSQEIYCMQHRKKVSANCVLLHTNRDACLLCSSELIVNEETGECEQLEGCALIHQITRECLLVERLNGYIGEDGSFQELEQLGTCMTNRRDPICLKLDSFGNILNCIVVAESDSYTGQKCVQCKNQYYPNESGVCEGIRDEYCQLSDGKTSECLFCIVGLIFDQKKRECVAQFPQILRCEEMWKQKCKRCQSLFYPTENGLVCTSISNPACTYSDGHSDTCVCQNNNHSSNCNFHFCERINHEEGVCEQCRSGYSLIQIGKQKNNLLCLDLSLLRCARISVEDYKCEECYAGYFLTPDESSEQICERISIPHCNRVGDFTYNCIQCDAGYFLSSKGACVEVKHCLQFDKNCTACEPTYLLNEFGLCEFVQFCVKSIGNECILCESTFYLSDSKQACLPIPNCAVSFGRKNICSQCLPSFKSVAFTCVPITRISHCKDYQDSTCIKCQYLYFLNASGNCQKINNEMNCRYSDGITNACRQCETNGYILIDYVSCKIIPNCLISNGFDKCVYCNKLFYRSKQIISKESFSNQGHYSDVCLPRKVIPNCAFYDSNAQICDTCEQQFYLSENRQECLQITDKLQEQQQRIQCLRTDGRSKECMICSRVPNHLQKSKFSMSSMTFRAEFFETMRSDCDSIYLIDARIICSQNYFSQSNTCQPRLDNDSNDNCLAYHTTQNGCKVCKSGYTLRDSDKDDLLPFGSYCERIPTANRVDNCSEYEANSTVCAKCKQNLHLDILEFYLDRKTNSCVEIRQELYFYKRKEIGNQEVKDTVSEQQDEEQEQLTKHIPFCVKEIPVCQTCSQRKCLLCENGFYLKDTICESHSYLHGCAVYNKSLKDHCDTCENGYFLDSSMCRKYFDSYCDPFYQSSYYCIQCANGYGFINAGLFCEKIEVRNCHRITIQNSEIRCVSCKKGFEFNSKNECIYKSPPDIYCASFEGIPTSDHSLHPEHTCLKCRAGFFLTSLGRCILEHSICSIPSCISYSLDSLPDEYFCKDCAEGFQLDPITRQCVVTIQTSGGGGGEEKDEKDQNEDKESVKSKKNSDDKLSEDENPTSDSRTMFILLISIGSICVLILIAWLVVYAREKYRVWWNMQNSDNPLLNSTSTAVSTLAFQLQILSEKSTHKSISNSP